MGTIQKPKPVKLFMAITYKKSHHYQQVVQLLTHRFGMVDLVYQYDFSLFTDYYSFEMGDELKKNLISFFPLISKEKIYRLKRYSNKMEERFADQSDYPIKRYVNIDPGYLTEAKVLLLTTKNFAHRVYISRGIFAEITLTYRKNSYTPNNWTYPDYQSPRVIQHFNEMREIYRDQLR